MPAGQRTCQRNRQTNASELAAGSAFKLWLDGVLGDAGWRSQARRANPRGGGDEDGALGRGGVCGSAHAGPKNSETDAPTHRRHAGTGLVRAFAGKALRAVGGEHAGAVGPRARGTAKLHQVLGQAGHLGTALVAHLARRTRGQDRGAQ